MEAFKLLIAFFTLQALLLVPSTQGNLFRTYIGSSSNGIVFSDHPIHPGVEFHFILAFGVDCTALDSSPTDGIFNVFWDSEHLTSDQVLAIKNSNPNVKVVLSIGGDSCGTQSLKFDATSVDSWVSNAVSSLTEIINEYNLDGIDIDYEQFIADSNTFGECMGQLVTQLKQNGVISIASIAPFDDENVQVYYQGLWNSYGNLFDYVNFQFYAYEKGTTVSEFVEYFDMQTSNYNGGNILASFATNDGGGLSPEAGFFDACKQLKSEGKLGGIFVWSADDSKDSGFAFEQQSQELLAGDGISA